MRKNLLPIIALAVIAAFFAPATTYADSIVSFAPSFQSGIIGDTFSVDIVISGLNGDEIGGFDIGVMFNNAILSGQSVTMGTGLGTGSDQFTLLSTFVGNTAQLFQFSFLSETALQGLQGNSFTLATLTFMGIANGVSPLTFTNAIFADGDFNTLQAPVTTQTGSIQVGQTVALPASGTIVLMGSGLAALALVRLRRKADQYASAVLKS